MKAVAVVLAIAFLAQVGEAQTTQDPFAADDNRPQQVEAQASNQRVELSWKPPTNGAQGYRVYVFEGGIETRNQSTNETRIMFFLTNGQTYAFQVSALATDGTEGPRSNPVAATPRLENDLAYLAAGLIAVWVGIFGYAAFLSRKEASIDRKLEQLLQARFQGRSP